MEATDMRPEFLSYEQTRQVYGLSRQATWKAIRAGKVEAFKVGRKVMLSRQSLEQYIRTEPFNAS
jgi:excisionase family DNA binding protein